MSRQTAVDDFEYHKNELLTGIHGSVSQDGDISTLFVTCKERSPFSLNVTLSAMSMLAHEVRSASLIMNYRQRLRLDRGANSILELCATALRPTDIEFLIDSNTGDRLMVVQFAENSPMVLRFEPGALVAYMAKLAALNDRTSH